MNLPAWLESESEHSVTVQLRLQPRASKNEIVATDAGATQLRVRVMARPVDDAANAALIKFLSEFTGIKRGAIRIVSGLRSRNKKVNLNGLDPLVFLNKLGVKEAD